MRRIPARGRAIVRASGQQTTKTSKSPSFAGLKPRSTAASRVARSVRKTDSKAEVALRKALWAMGHRYRKNVRSLPGTPDLVFPRARTVVFCDGDFWHGRNW